MIIVSGASGAFGRATAEILIERTDPAGLILTSRTPEKLADLAARGAQVRHADFDRPETLEQAFRGGSRMLLISTARVGSRVEQHRNAVEAAKRAGVGLIAYTSLINADRDDNPAIVKRDHHATEEIMEASGVPYVFLRDSHYLEAICVAMVGGALLSGGRMLDNTGSRRIGAISRDDCVAVAAEVLLGEGHANQAYDLASDETITIAEAMALASALSGRPITIVPATEDEMYAYFDALGAPRHASDVVPDGPIPWSSDDMVTFGQAIREGFFDKTSDIVERLTGRKPKRLRDVMEASQPLWPK